MPEFKLEHGKRYVTRDGRVTDGLVFDRRLASDQFKQWPFWGSLDGEDMSWDGLGVWTTTKSKNDLVREYVEPTPPRYKLFTAADYIDHLHNRVIVHPVHGRQVITSMISTRAFVIPANTYIEWGQLIEWTYEDTGKPVGREVTA